MFPRLESFLHEVMRHTTFVPLTIPHLTIEDTVLRGYGIPKNTVVWENQYSANHDTRCWDSPEEFMATRFLDDKGNLVHRPADQYMLFSAGARKCPGEHYAFTLGVHLMATLLSVCSFVEYPEAPPSLKLKFNLSMRPPPFRVDVKLRKALLYKKMVENIQNDASADKTHVSNNNTVPVNKTNGITTHHRNGNGHVKTEVLKNGHVNSSANGDLSKRKLFAVEKRHIYSKGVS